MKNKRRRSRATGMDTTPTQSKKENVKILLGVGSKYCLSSHRVDPNTSGRVVYVAEFWSWNIPIFKYYTEI